MKKNLLLLLNKLMWVALLFMIATNTYGYDFLAKNSDGVDIYYEFVYGKKSVKVTYCHDYYYYGNVVIPESAFYNGRSYKVTSIGYRAFYECWDLESVSIPNSVTSIDNEAFCGSGLTSIILPNSVTEIGSQAFAYCKRLISFTIPANLKTINVKINGRDYWGNLLMGCKSLESLNVASGNPVYDSRDKCNAIIETATNTLLLGCKNTVIPNSVTAIGAFAFFGMGVTNITIPKSVKTIGNYSFSNSDLTSINIPNSVTSIGGSAFVDCSSLTSITIPNSVTSIGGSAFRNCSGLTSITIPNSVTSIGGNAFAYCSGLTSIVIGNGVLDIGDIGFFGCSSLKEISCLPIVPPKIVVFSNFIDPVDYSNCILYVPRGRYSAYYNSEWNRFKRIIERDMTDIETMVEETAKEVVRYNMNGVRIGTPYKGLNTIRMSDGTTKKVYVK